MASLHNLYPCRKHLVLAGEGEESFFILRVLAVEDAFQLVHLFAVDLRLLPVDLIEGKKVLSEMGAQLTDDFLPVIID